MKDRDHPILESPWTYDIVDLHFHRSPEAPSYVVVQKSSGEISE